MFADKQYLIDLCNKFNICTYSSNESPMEAVIQWYNDLKEKEINSIKLKDFDAQSVLNYFDEDIASLYNIDCR